MFKNNIANRILKLAGFWLIVIILSINNSISLSNPVLLSFIAVLAILFTFFQFYQVVSERKLKRQ
ncbi:hypothetical protein D8M04_03455 [Oceanobacillus piezotolerans]|uniref:Uncharacterized protein n=1 Tax=Oceanobacillus piezotolerans TaxID=2448030 RepID=A0A498DB30_9BACI|nr:hypothetical protein [Oceanobacillus piezotolerans]RLL48334.1 hypothetical protein D8M04_03455 [Oceanobacillus piezotolerans]